MKIAFFLAEGRSTSSYVLADAMLRSVRRCMPWADVIQFTDEHSSQLWDTDGIVRKDGSNFMRLRLQHYAAPGEWLFLDTDILAQRDVWSVFDEAWDIAVPDRVGSLFPAEVGSPFIERMPHNMGVVFSRQPEFWKACIEKFDRLPAQEQDSIASDQLCMCDTIKECRFNVRVLPGQDFNVSPLAEDQDVSGAAFAHYKGNRKHWMMKKIYGELQLA